MIKSDNWIEDNHIEEVMVENRPLQLRRIYIYLCMSVYVCVKQAGYAFLL